ncbi:MAG: riboflavin synthase [Bacteroidia bacterium]|nr:riboflavin synthase [Bacteroidia bacterium]
MFTGIIEEIGLVRTVSPLGKGRSLEIAASVALRDLATGDSIAVNGACLTVISFSKDSFTVEAVEETVKKTTIGSFRSGWRVNLERALRVGGKLGGHFVQGHVDFTSRILSVERRQESWMVEIGFPPQAAANIIPQGSICIDGVSLTVAEKSTSSFRVSVIPHTWSNTLFASLAKGSDVNIELDMIGKYVLSYVSQGKSGGVTNEFLEKLGY